MARVPASEQVVRAFVSNLRNLPKWDRTAKKVTRVGVGQYDVVFKLGKSMPLSTVRYTVTNENFGPLLMESTGAYVKTKERVTFEALDPSVTTVVWAAYIEFTGMAACFAPCLGGMIRGAAENAQRGLVQYFSENRV